MVGTEEEIEAEVLWAAGRPGVVNAEARAEQAASEKAVSDALGAAVAAKRPAAAKSKRAAVKKEAAKAKF
eukprot:7397961-Alexandrium_andersonii.AAC.1